jgi:hypothetical protein
MSTPFNLHGPTQSSDGGSNFSDFGAGIGKKRDLAVLEDDEEEAQMSEPLSSPSH